jgi:hypothetical protein
MDALLAALDVEQFWALVVKATKPKNAIKRNTCFMLIIILINKMLLKYNCYS